jgi:hypothetical protein
VTKMKQKWVIIFIFLVVIFSSWELPGDYLHTVDRKVYEGKMVAFKFNTIYFNVYKFGKIYHTKRFPLYKVWKIEFNTPRTEGLESPFEVEQNYNKLRKGKRYKKIQLDATQKWIDTGIDVEIGKEVLFSASGSIYINKETLVYQNGELEPNWNKKKPLPNQPTGAIIGRVGKKGDMFYIGDDKAPFQMAQKGHLFIGINDFDFSDNSGKFVITIYY